MEVDGNDMEGISRLPFHDLQSAESRLSTTGSPRHSRGPVYQ